MIKLFTYHIWACCWRRHCRRVWGWLCLLFKTPPPSCLLVTVWTSCTTTSSTPSTSPVTTRWSSSYTSISRTPSCSEKRNTSTCSSTQRSERSPQVQPLPKHFILLLFCLGGKSLTCLEGRLISRLFGKNTILFCSFNVSLILWCGFLSQGRHF